MHLRLPNQLTVFVRAQAVHTGGTVELRGQVAIGPASASAAITMLEPVQLDSRTWRVSWSYPAQDPTFYVYRDGVLLGSTQQTWWDFALDSGEGLVIEVQADAGRLPVSAFPARLTLCWYAAADAEHYRIEEYVGTTWTLRARLRDRGQGYFTWNTRPLEDETTHQFRIIPVGDNGNQGTALTFSCLMVRHPDPPQVGYSYSNTTHAVTIAAA